MKSFGRSTRWMGLPLTLLCAVGVAGCDTDDDDTTGDDDASQSSPTPEATPTPAPSPEVTPTATPVVTPTPEPTLEPTPTSPPEPNALDVALNAVGGEELVLGLKTLQLEAYGDRAEFAEAYAPGEDAEEVSSFTLLVDQDLSADQLRLDWNRTIEVLWYGGTDYTETISGQKGIVEGYDWYFGGTSGNQGVMGSARVAMVKRQQRLFSPVTLLQEAASHPERVEILEDQVVDFTLYHVLELEDSVAPLTFYVNASTGLIDRLVTQEADHTLGDVELELVYSNWQEASDSALRFPYFVSLSMNGNVLQEELRDVVRVNPALDASTFTAASSLETTWDEAQAERGEHFTQWTQRFIAIGLPLDFVDSYVTPVEILTSEVPENSGVWQLTGASHHSFVVEQEDGLVVVEAPLYEEKSQALLNAIHTQWPDKDIKYVVATHWHTDHVGGLRAFVAEGATIVVGESTRAFYEQIFSASHALVPDALELNPVAANILTVPNNANGDTLILGEGDKNQVEVTHIAVDHAGDMAIVQIPSLSLSLNGDLYNPSASGATSPLYPPYTIGSPQLYEAMVDANITPKYLGAIHSTAVRPFNDLRTHVGARVELPGEGLYPEGIAADSAGDLYIGSTGTGEIFKVTPGLPPASVLVESVGDGMSAIGLLIDEPNQLLYACYTSFSTGAAEVRSFDLATGDRKNSWPVDLGGSTHLANDMVLDPAGNLYVTDSYAQVILRLPVGGEAFEIWSDSALYKADGQITLNGIVYRDGQILVTNANAGQLYRVNVDEDGSAGTPVEITLDRAISGGDGMELLSNGDLLVVSASLGVVQIALDGDTGTVSDVATGFRYPTTVSVVGDYGWVVESQFDCLYGYCTASTPFGAMRFDL